MTNPPPQPQQQPYQTPAHQHAQQPQEKCTLALVSMVLGICSFFTWILTGIPAVICGHIAKSKIKKSGGRLTGSGMATTGLICGYVSFGLIFVIAFFAAIATPVIMKQKQKADQVQTMNNAKEIFVYLVEYDDDYGHLPDSLDDIQASDPSYIADDLKPRRGNWEYHGAGKSLSAPSGSILLSWNQEQADKWVVMRMDGSITVLKDSEYQAALLAQESP